MDNITPQQVKTHCNMLVFGIQGDKSYFCVCVPCFQGHGKSKQSETQSETKYVPVVKPTPILERVKCLYREI